MKRIAYFVVAACLLSSMALAAWMHSGAIIGSFDEGLKHDRAENTLPARDPDAEAEPDFRSVISALDQGEARQVTPSFRPGQPTAQKDAGNPVAPTPFDVPTPGDTIPWGTQKSAAIAFGGGIHLAVWQDTRSGMSALHATRIAPDGTVLDPYGIWVGGGAYGPPVSPPPSVAFVDDVFIIVWADHSIPDFTLRATRIDLDGNILDSDGIEVSTSSYVYDIACLDTGCLIVWGDYADTPPYGKIHGRRIAPDGSLPDEAPLEIGEESYNISRLSIAASSSQYFVAWSSVLMSKYPIKGTRVSALGAPLDSPSLAILSYPAESSANQPRFDIASDGTDFAMVYERGDYPDTAVYRRMIRENGTLEAAQALASSNLCRMPTIVSLGSGYFAAWNYSGSSVQSNEIRGIRLDGNGQPATAAVTLAPYPELETFYPAISLAFDGTDVALLHDHSVLKTSGTADIIVEFRRFSTNGISLDADAVLPARSLDTQIEPAMAMDGQTAWVVWQRFDGRQSDVVALRLSPAGIPLDPTGIPVTSDPLMQATPSIAYANQSERILIVYAGAQRIYARRYDRDGTALDANPLQIYVSYASNFYPKVASDGTDFLVAWVNDSRDDVMTQVVHADGSMGTQTTTDCLSGARVALAYGDDTYLLATSARPRVEAQRYDTTGAKIGDAMTIADNLVGSHMSVAFDQTRFVVAWKGSTVQDDQIHAARLTTAGTLLDAGGVVVSDTAGDTKEDVFALAWQGGSLLLWVDADEATHRRIAGAAVATDGTVRANIVSRDHVSPYPMWSPMAAAIGEDIRLTYVRYNPDVHTLRLETGDVGLLHCTIDGRDIPHLAVNGENDCEICRADVAPDAWSPRAQGTVCGENDDCRNAGTCTAEGRCEAVPLDDGTPCNADADGCTVGDACRSGVCTAGAVADCSEHNNQCNTGVCRSTGDDSYGCVKDPTDNVGAACGDAATECSAQDTCNGEGVCQANDFGTDHACGDAATECVNQDYCDGSGSCTDNGFVAVGTTCGDGLTECSAQDTCNGEGVCQANDMPDNTGCDDLDLCTGDDVCIAGECVGTATDCADDHACTADTCDPGTGQCVHTADDSLCDDAGECTADACSVDTGCSHADLADWTACGEGDDDACFTGVCEPLGENDTCETAIELTAGTQKEATFAGFHSYRDASTACGVENLRGRDAFFVFSYEPGYAYTITATPSEYLDIALVGWEDCSDGRCVEAIDAGGAGDAETVTGMIPEAAGSMIVQIIDLTAGEPGDDAGFSVLMDRSPVADGDLDADSQADGDEEDMDGTDIGDPELEPEAMDSADDVAELEVDAEFEADAEFEIDAGTETADRDIADVDGDAGEIETDADPAEDREDDADIAKPSDGSAGSGCRSGGGVFWGFLLLMLLGFGGFLRRRTVPR